MSEEKNENWYWGGRQFYKKWTVEGNYYKKNFTKRGQVHVGIGDNKTIVYSYGPNSDESLSSSRGRLSEQQAMKMVDDQKGKYIGKIYLNQESLIEMLALNRKVYFYGEFTKDWIPTIAIIKYIPREQNNFRFNGDIVLLNLINGETEQIHWSGQKLFVYSPNNGWNYEYPVGLVENN